MKEEEMGRACSRHGDEEECIRSLVGKQEGERPLGRLDIGGRMMSE
jgi:hypothetical protein